MMCAARIGLDFRLLTQQLIFVDDDKKMKTAFDENKLTCVTMMMKATKMGNFHQNDVDDNEN